MNRGSIVWVNLEDAAPPEFNKVRPALVISNSEVNEALPTIVAIPISTRAGEIWPLRLKMPAISGMKNSFLVLPGIRQINKARVLKVISIAPDSFLSQVDEALAAYLQD